jgi:hypothetical protein
MPKRDIMAGVVALGEENPKRFLNLMRKGWPEIKAAIDQGHTLKVIHQRLVTGGVQMTYRCFTAYVRRLKKEFAETTTAIPIEKIDTPPERSSQSTEASLRPVESETDNQSTASRDPYQTIREHLNRRPPGFHWEEDAAETDKAV